MVVAEFNKTRLNVVGHTDSTGSRDLNMRLSAQRADAVAAQLIGQGVSGSRITTTGVGPDQPVATNSTAAGKAQNRRVTITLTPTA
jgi:outer membrane protein OmpA-like peptidoglycan-associated protein